MCSYSLIIDPQGGRHILNWKTKQKKPKILSYKRKLTLSDVSFVYEAWQHMTVLDTEVIMRTKHVRGNHSSIATPMLLEIRPVKHTHSFTDNSYSCDEFTKTCYSTKPTTEFPPVMNINHSLCVGIAKVRLMRWTIMDLVQRSKVSHHSQIYWYMPANSTHIGTFTMVSSIG